MENDNNVQYCLMLDLRLSKTPVIDVNSIFFIINDFLPR